MCTPQTMYKNIISMLYMISKQQSIMPSSIFKNYDLLLFTHTLYIYIRSVYISDYKMAAGQSMHVMVYTSYTQ